MLEKGEPSEKRLPTASPDAGSTAPDREPLGRSCDGGREVGQRVLHERESDGKKEKRKERNSPSL